MWVGCDKRARGIGLWGECRLGDWGMGCRKSGESSPGDNFPHVIHSAFPQDCGQPSGDNVSGTKSTASLTKTTKSREPLMHHRCSEWRARNPRLFLPHL